MKSRTKSNKILLNKSIATADSVDNSVHSNSIVTVHLALLTESPWTQQKLPARSQSDLDLGNWGSGEKKLHVFIFECSVPTHLPSESGNIQIRHVPAFAVVQSSLS